MTITSLATIVIPSRNRPSFARPAVVCALGQVGVDVDIVVVDDGSDSPLAAALVDLVAGSDGRVRMLRNEVSIGVAAARNRGIAEASGAWVGFCDDDDVWAPTTRNWSRTFGAP